MLGIRWNPVEPRGIVKNAQHSYRFLSTCDTDNKDATTIELWRGRLLDESGHAESDGTLRSLIRLLYEGQSALVVRYPAD